MEQLNVSDSGNTFIGKLNNKFSRAEGRVSNVPMQGGRIGSDGFPKGSITTDTDFTNYAHSVNYIELNSPMTAATTSVGTLKFHCFDAAYTYLGSADSIDTLKAGTDMIRIEVLNSSELAALPTVTITTSGDVSFRKANHAKLTAKFFCFETEIPYLNPGNGTSYYGHNGRYYDQGYIKLPPNYTPDGAPVQLVIYCHGSNGYQWGETSVNVDYNYDILLEFICNNGFAVVDCSGLTSYWMKSTNNPFYNDTNCRKNSKWQPTAYSAYCNLYDYIIDNYNICADGVYIFGKSAGGMGANLLACSQPFPIRAAGGLAPTTSMNCADMRHGYVSRNVLKQWLLMFGAENYDSITSDGGAQMHVGNADLPLLLADAPLFIGYDGLTSMTDIDLVDMTQKMYAVEVSAYGTTAAIQSIFANAHKIQPCPYKIWLAQDDAVIPWAIAEYYKQMVDRGNGICELREMPSGTGGHHSVDTDSNAPKVNYQTKYGGVVNIPVAYAELVDWFLRW